LLTVVLVAVALLAAGLSIPVYVFLIMGAGMSVSSPHLGFDSACMLWALPAICTAASLGFLLIQRPPKKWRWFVAVPLILLSLAEGLATLLMLWEG
jgi:hypothetical protein